MTQIAQCSSRLFQTMIVMTMVSGCAYLKPYVDVHQVDQAVSVPENPALPQVSSAVQTLRTWEKGVQEKRNDSSLSHRSLDLATFGLATAAVVAPVYNAYSQVVSMFGLGAGAAYAANTLFSPSDQTQLYNAAFTALTCVRNRAEAVQSAVTPQTTPQAMKQQFAADFLNVVSAACQQTPEFERLTSAFESAHDAAQRVVDNDYAAGKKVVQAGTNVLITLNQEIDKRAPSSEAIFAAAKSLVSLNGGLPTSKAVAAVKVVAKAPCNEDPSRFVRQAVFYEQRQKTLDGALEGLNELSSACTLTADPVPDLSVSQADVVLTKDVSINIVISGGRPPYTTSWETNPGTDVVLQNTTPNLFTLRGTADIKSAATYKLDVRDSSIGGRLKVITVTTKVTS